MAYSLNITLVHNLMATHCKSCWYKFCLQYNLSILKSSQKSCLHANKHITNIAFFTYIRFFTSDTRANTMVQSKHKKLQHTVESIAPLLNQHQSPSAYRTQFLYKLFIAFTFQTQVPSWSERSLSSAKYYYFIIVMRVY